MENYVGLGVIVATIAFIIGRWSGRKAEAREHGWSRERGNAELIERMRAPEARPSTPAAGDMEAVEAALRAGQKIIAIKLYRDISGVGLKEAKDYVEALERELGL